MSFNPGSLSAGGTEILLYPFARAFGSPSEAELARCRNAWRQFQATLATQPVVAVPVLVAAGRSSEWRADVVQLLAGRISAAGALQVRAIAEPPAVEPLPMGSNQLRYAWKRAAQYAEWVKRMPAHPEYVLLVEVWAGPEQIGGIHFFLVSPEGQVAYCRWFNSHQFGKLPFTGDAWIEFAAGRFLRDLKRSAEELFPPYGVG